MSAFVLVLALSALLKYGNGRANAEQCLNGCYCDYTSLLNLDTAMQYENRIENITEWPNGCHCHFTSALTHLSIDCAHSGAAVSEEQLSRHLDSFLSSDYITEHATALIITNTPLTHVPASVCQLLNLTTLILEHDSHTGRCE